MSLDDELDDDDLRERVAAHEAEANELRQARGERVKALRAQGMSFRDIAGRLGVSVATAHADSAEPSIDDWIRAKAGRGPAQDDAQSVDGNEWLRNRTFNTGAYGRKRAIRDALAGITDEEGDAQ